MDTIYRMQGNFRVKHQQSEYFYSVQLGRGSPLRTWLAISSVCKADFLSLLRAKRVEGLDLESSWQLFRKQYHAGHTRNRRFE